MEQSLRLTRDSLSRPWGFRLQGGSDTGSPLMVQRVFSGSPAEGILNRGDVILSMDGKDCRHITHKESLEIIRISGGSLHMIVLRGGGNNSFSAIQDEPTRSTFVSPKRQQPLRSQSQFTSYVAPNSPSLHRMTQSVYQSSQNDVEDASLQNIESDPDYDFIHKSVSERRQMFNAPPKTETVIKPRGRIQSYRPFTDFGAPNPAFGKRPEFGWCPSEEKMRAARMNKLSSTSVGQIHQPSTPLIARAQTARPSTAMYAASTLPNSYGSGRQEPSRSAQHHQQQQHSSTVVLQSSLPSQQSQPSHTYIQPTSYRPQQSSQQLSSHVATLPRPARSFSTSHAPSNNWSPTMHNNNYQTSNDVFGENDYYSGRPKPLKINLYDSEPQQYSQHHGRQEIHPAFPVNSPHARGPAGSAGFSNQPSGNVRYVGALDGASYRPQESSVTPVKIGTVASQPSAFTSNAAKSTHSSGINGPTVHYIRKVSPARNVYSQPPPTSSNRGQISSVSSSAFVTTRPSVVNRQPPPAIDFSSSDF